MILGLMGKKVGMTQVFRGDGRAEAVTVVEAGPCTVVQVKTEARDGYSAVQLGFGHKRRLIRPEKGHLKDWGNLRYLREFEAEEYAELSAGQRVDVSIFQVGERVDVTGVSKGRGFAGVVKRHGFHGGPKTHGQSDRHRAGGSIGASASPGRVWKGMRMAGHMGNARVTVRRLEVMEADPERNLLLLRGAVPGARDSLLIICKTKRHPRRQAAG